MRRNRIICAPGLMASPLRIADHGQPQPLASPADKAQLIGSPPSWPTPDRILRLPEVIEIVGLCAASIYNMMRQEPPKFPRGLRLSPGSVGWRASAITAWMDGLPVAEPTVGPHLTAVPTVAPAPTNHGAKKYADPAPAQYTTGHRRRGR